MIAELMDRFVEFATVWCSLVLLAAWRALPILLIVTGIGLALRRKYSPSLSALFLTLVLVRLLLPVSIGSSLSLQRPIDSWFSSNSGDIADRTQAPRDYAYGILPNAGSRDMPVAPWQAMAEPVRDADRSLSHALIATTLFLMVAVTIGFVLRGVLSHIRFAIKLRSCRLLDQPALIDLLLRECDSLAVGRRPALRT